MPVRRETRRGKRHLVLDIRYRKPDGSQARYRRDSQAATMAAAREEERAIQDRIARTGSPYDPLEDNGGESNSAQSVTFKRVASEFLAQHAMANLKLTTVRGYKVIISTHLLPRFGAWDVSSVDRHAVHRLDVDLAKKKKSKGTRNNVQIVLRSILKYAKARGYLLDVPKGLPSLKVQTDKVLDVPDDQQVQAILDRANSRQRRALMLMAHAGLRPNEVRALRARDVLLTWRDGKPTSGRIKVKEGLSYGQVHTPKTGQREIPIRGTLLHELAGVAKLKRDDYITGSVQGKPWGQFGLYRAFGRACKRAGLGDEWTVYCLRHYAITSWLRAGIPVHTVQRMAGHSNLSTTQRYVHHIAADLDAAGEIMGNIWATPPP